MVAKKNSPNHSPDHASEKSLDFETALKALETLVNRMEKGDLSLEESLKAFEEGVRLTRLCQETLSAAQQKVQVLMQAQGASTLQPFTPDDDVQESTSVAAGRKP